MHLDDRPADAPGFRVPDYVIADLECSLHESGSLLSFRIQRQCQGLAVRR
jgi:hypothetical protein